jgi:hypothetical protein
MVEGEDFIQTAACRRRFGPVKRLSSERIEARPLDQQEQAPEDTTRQTAPFRILGAAIREALGTMPTPPEQPR